MTVKEGNWYRCKKDFEFPLRNLTAKVQVGAGSYCRIKSIDFSHIIMQVKWNAIIEIAWSAFLEYFEEP